MSYTSALLSHPLATVPLRATPHRLAPPHSAATMPPIPKSMSGVVIEQTGGVEVLTWKTDLPVPEPKEGEVLIKNDFIGVNYIDTYAHLCSQALDCYLFD